MTPTAPPGLLSFPQLADMLGCSTGQAYSYDKDGTLASWGIETVHSAARRRFVRRAEVARFLAGATIDAAPQIVTHRHEVVLSLSALGLHDSQSHETAGGYTKLPEVSL